MDGNGLLGYYPTLVVFGPGGASQSYGQIKGENEQTKIAAMIARLGSEGWELVAAGAIPFSSESRHMLYFKRLIE
jgi:hypothetical protein